MTLKKELKLLKKAAELFKNNEATIDPETLVILLLDATDRVLNLENPYGKK